MRMDGSEQNKLTKMGKRFLKNVGIKMEMKKSVINSAPEFQPVRMDLV